MDQPASQPTITITISSSCRIVGYYLQYITYEMYITHDLSWKYQLTIEEV